MDLFQLFLHQFISYLESSIVVESITSQIHTTNELVVDIHSLALGSILIHLLLMHHDLFN